MRIWDTVFSTLTDEVEYAVKRAIAPLPQYLKKISFGIVFIVLAGVAAYVALLALAAGLFLTFADLPFVAAAFWVSLCFLGSALLLALFGLFALRPPR